jgi:hypothetical protein
MRINSGDGVKMQRKKLEKTTSNETLLRNVTPKFAIKKTGQTSSCLVLVGEALIPVCILRKKTRKIMWL